MRKPAAAGQTRRRAGRGLGTGTGTGNGPEAGERPARRAAGGSAAQAKRPSASSGKRQTGPQAKAKSHTAQQAERPSRRQTKHQAERREAILAAALAEFSERGFTAARLDDVARRAGIAKGTIYLYFRDKESLFEDLIRTRLLPLVGTLEQLRGLEMPLRVVAERLVELFVREVYGTPRRDVIRLMIAEGARFPKLAEFYYREVLSRIMEVLSGLVRAAQARGEIDSAALARHPQLLVAPGVVAIIWNGLFDRFAPLDLRALMQAHIDLILKPDRPPETPS